MSNIADRIDFIETDTGFIQCPLDSTYWCEHVEELVKEDVDGMYIWSDYIYQKVQVPIVPTSNVWADCRLQPVSVDKSGRMYKLLFRIQDDPSVEGIFIGFILPGEGRRVMRSMLLDWFVGTHDETVSCNSAGHGYKQTMQLMKDLKDPARKIAQGWSIVMTGKCLGCTFNMADNADLVPADDRPSPFR